MISDRARPHAAAPLTLPTWSIPADRLRGLGFACAVATAGPVLLLVDGIHPLLRLVLALLLVVLAPGYSVMLAACPGPSIAGTERLVLSVSVSMALAVLGGLLLNWTPFGLRPESWVILLSGVTLVAAVIAAARLRQPQATQRVKVRPARSGGGFGIGSVCLVTVAVTIVSATILLARISAGTPIEAGFSDLWMLPDEGAPTPSVRLGIRSQEETRTPYRLRLDVDGVPAATWQSIELEPGEIWQSTVTLLPDTPRSAVVEARLYRADGSVQGPAKVGDEETPYRRVELRR